MAGSSNNNGYIKLYKKMLKWEWYDDVNTKILFLHCLLKANWESTKWHGVELQAGQFVTSLATLAEETKLTIRQTRVALDHLNMTGEVTSKCQSKYRIITVNSWSQYQGNDKEVTSKRQANDKQNDKQMTTVKEIKNKRIKEIKNIYGEFRHVSLTETERDRLFKDYGEAETLEAIKFLDEYKERKGYTSKNDNLTLRKWVFDAVKRDKAQGTQSQSQSQSQSSSPVVNPKAHNFEEREYDYAALEQEVLKGGQGDG